MSYNWKLSPGDIITLKLASSEEMIGSLVEEDNDFFYH
jgi:hypothetical protein